MAWSSSDEPKHISTPTFISERGVFLKNARPIQYGLGAGTSDLIGFTEMEITHDMVGKKVAVFTAIEVKSDRGRVSPKQQRFIDFVNERGGIASIARAVENAARIIFNWRPK